MAADPLKGLVLMELELDFEGRLISLYVRFVGECESTVGLLLVTDVEASDAALLIK